MELARKYTDEIYATKKEIERYFSTIGIEVIWFEILRYREKFRHSCFIQQYYVVLTPAINQKLDEILSLMTPSNALMTTDDYNELLLDYSYEFHHFTTHPFLLQLFLIQLIPNQTLRNSILHLCLMTYGYVNQEPIILRSFEIVTSDIENLDITRAFLDWLMLLRIYCEESVVNLNRKARKIDKDLKLLYPTLSSQQCDFLMTHNQPFHYYDVKSYMDANLCSYETARTHLQGLVDEHFYRKIKIGKRFVYLLEEV